MNIHAKLIHSNNARYMPLRMSRCFPELDGSDKYHRRTEIWLRTIPLHTTGAGIEHKQAGTAAICTGT
jgi:hypothetical protein